jgi:hypothetical protein
MNDEINRIRALSNAKFHRMLKPIGEGLNNWWSASAILSIAYDILTEEQKSAIRKSYEAKFRKDFPDIESFLNLGRRQNRFEEFFLAYENHLRSHKPGSSGMDYDDNCIICDLERS